MKAMFHIVDLLASLGLFVLGFLTFVGSFIDGVDLGVTAYGAFWMYVAIRLNRLSRKKE